MAGEQGRGVKAGLLEGPSPRPARHSTDERQEGGPACVRLLRQRSGPGARGGSLGAAYASGAYPEHLGVGLGRRDLGSEAAWGGMRMTPRRQGTSKGVWSLKSGSVPNELQRTASAHGRPESLGRRRLCWL